METREVEITNPDPLIIHGLIMCRVKRQDHFISTGYPLQANRALNARFPIPAFPQEQHTPVSGLADSSGYISPRNKVRSVSDGMTIFCENCGR